MKRMIKFGRTTKLYIANSEVNLLNNKKDETEVPFPSSQRGHLHRGLDCHCCVG